MCVCVYFVDIFNNQSSLLAGSSFTLDSRRFMLRRWRFVDYKRERHGVKLINKNIAFVNLEITLRLVERLWEYYMKIFV